MGRIKSTGYLLLLLLVLPAIVFAQKKVTLSGYMRNAETGESVQGGTIYIQEANQGIQTNNYGFYSISVPAGTYTITFSYIGYDTRVQKMSLVDNTTFNAEMNNKTTMKEVEVTAKRKDENVNSTAMGTTTLGIQQIKLLPVLLGETDILKSLQLLPGVQSAGDGNAGFYVRGGGPDQNLVLLDDAVVYNTGHLFGFFSVFNGDAVKDVTLIKGGMPANYGGRLSSVIDVSMKEGNMKEYHVAGGIGLLASRLAIEGPIKKDKGSFIVSARRTYIDVITKPFLTGNLKNDGYYFYDANLKANYKLSDKDRVYLSGYLGQDKFSFTNKTGTFKANIPWGNTTATLRWNHQYSGKLFSNTSLIYNDYKFASNFGLNTFNIKSSSGIRDYTAKTDFDYYSSFGHHFKAGVSYTAHKFIPNQVSGQVDTVTLNPDNALIKYAHEAGAYVLDEFEPAKWLKINAGLRYSFFQQVGPYTKYTYDINDNKTDSTHYGTGAPVINYGGLEPRLNVRFALNDASSIKASVSKTYQYLHLVSNNGSTLPSDTWVPSTDVVKPQMAWQYSTGYFRNFLDNMLETSVEVYYKDMQHQVQYKDGYTPDNVSDPERSYVFGHGWSYGAEFFVNKTAGRFTGWVGYTLSWTWQQFPDLNNGNKFPAKYDRRHDLSVVGSYVYNKKWTFSSVFIYGSGNSITLPTAFYYLNGALREQYSAINAYRLPAYHRLDVSAVYTPHHSKPRKWEGSWTFSVFNIYDRFNPYFIYPDSEGTPSTGGITTTIKAVAIFRVIPAFTYNFKF